MSRPASTLPRVYFAFPSRQPKAAGWRRNCAATILLFFCSPIQLVRVHASHHPTLEAPSWHSCPHLLIFWICQNTENCIADCESSYRGKVLTTSWLQHYSENAIACPCWLDLQFTWLDRPITSEYPPTFDSWVSWQITISFSSMEKSTSSMVPWNFHLISKTYLAQSQSTY